MYVVVNRDNGRYIEWFRPIDWGDDDDAWFVDSGLDYDGGSAIDITSMSVDTNGYVTVNVTTNTLSDGDHILLSGATNGLEDIVYGVTNSTPTNFVLTVKGTNDKWQWRPDEITISTSGTIGVATAVPFEKYSNSRARYYLLDADDNSSYLINYVTAGPAWIIEGEYQGNQYYYQQLSSAWLPPQTGYSLALGDAPPSTLSWNDPSADSFTHVKNTFTNVSHLAEQTLNIFADGGVVPDETVSTNGVLVTDEYYNRVIAGLPYTARLSPMYLEVVNANTISYGRTKNPSKAHFRIKDSGTFNYGTSTNSLYPVSVRLPSLTAGSPVPFYSGDATTKMLDGAPSTNPEFWVTSGEPLPLELLSIMIFTDIKEYE